MPRVMTRRKRLNYRLIEWQKRLKAPVVLGYPYWLTIDPSGVCPLRCVYCPTGQRRGARPAAVLGFDAFRKVIDTLGPYLLHIDFCNWGEPLVNRELPRMIAYAARFGATMKVDTSLSVPLEERDADGLIGSGLDMLNVSIDGASPETYAVYRRGGDFDLVMKNLRLLVRRRRELGKRRPRLHWQFLVFRHNEHEIDKARALAAETGVDSIGFTAPFCAPEWASTIEEYNRYHVRGKGAALKPGRGICEWPWDGVTVNSDGSVSPCCSTEDAKDDFAPDVSRPFLLLWNGRQYRTARRFIRDRRSPERGNVCTACDHIGASNHERITIP